MGLNFIVGIASLLLLISPFLGTWINIADLFGFDYYGSLDAGYKLVFVIFGAIGLIAAFYNIVLRRSSGIFYIILGLGFIVTTYYYCGESLDAFVPRANVMLGGPSFFGLTLSLIIAILGLAQEFLLKREYTSV